MGWLRQRRFVLFGLVFFQFAVEIDARLRALIGAGVVDEAEVRAYLEEAIDEPGPASP